LEKTHLPGETGGTNVSSLARESAGKILSQQLNNLAGDLIEGVELSTLNTSDDYTTGPAGANRFECLEFP
jgi:hypothetical protein